MESNAYNEKEDGEDFMIKYIIDSILNNNENLIFDEVIEELVPYSDLETEKVTDETYFLSTSLFEFPIMCDLNSDQLKTIMKEFRQTMKPFHDEYKSLKREIASISFNESNIRIQSQIKSGIVPHLENIQKKIDENIYVQQQKNRYDPKQRIKVMLGVSSIENNIRLLEKEEVILPFVADSIIEKLEKNIDIKSCIPFIYHKLPALNNN